MDEKTANTIEQLHYGAAAVANAIDALARDLEAGDMPAAYAHAVIAECVIDGLSGAITEAKAAAMLAVEQDVLGGEADR